jgi:lipooligosaccharide transport system ATP-binding protein
MTDVIVARELQKRFGDIRAVDGISFRVHPGESFGLLGPNGAGKTTSIRMIYGFSPMTAGELEVFGLDIRKDWREIRRRVGVCQQEDNLDPDLSVGENLEVFAGYFGVPPRVSRARATQLLAFTELTHRRKSKVDELSGGMKRRLMLARALINEPRLLILDEPTVGVDSAGQQTFFELLLDLKRRFALTVLMVSHDIGQMQHYADQVACMATTVHFHGKAELLSEEVLEKVYACELDAFYARRAALDHDHALGHPRIHGEESP